MRKKQKFCPFRPVLYERENSARGRTRALRVRKRTLLKIENGKLKVIEKFGKPNFKINRRGRKRNNNEQQNIQFQVKNIRTF